MFSGHRVEAVGRKETFKCRTWPLQVCLGRVATILCGFVSLDSVFGYESLSMGELSIMSFDTTRCLSLESH